ncbi:MAG: hypothetical protein BWY32_02621 [bacterium ADurb.Bin243]|nr:MAG: hypothetical protein BWY32_02621 [bacterium ADurb.Bin243]
MKLRPDFKPARGHQDGHIGKYDRVRAYGIQENQIVVERFQLIFVHYCVYGYIYFFVHAVQVIYCICQLFAGKVFPFRSQRKIRRAAVNRVGAEVGRDFEFFHIARADDQLGLFN